ncbi:MAG: hypothetical protein ICV86_12275 [Microcoleus sp. T3-bin5]|nr:hypothetical protein [Microcoleus sp. T3-bin5]
MLETALLLGLPRSKLELLMALADWFSGAWFGLLHPWFLKTNLRKPRRR